MDPAYHDATCTIAKYLPFYIRISFGTVVKCARNKYSTCKRISTRNVSVLVGTNERIFATYSNELTGHS